MRIGRDQDSMYACFENSATGNDGVLLYSYLVSGQ